MVNVCGWRNIPLFGRQVLEWQSVITFLLSNGENAVQKEENSRRKIRKNETYFSFGIVIIDICKSIFRLLTFTFSFLLLLIWVFFFLMRLVNDFSIFFIFSKYHLLISLIFAMSPSFPFHVFLLLFSWFLSFYYLFFVVVLFVLLALCVKLGCLIDGSLVS